MFITKSDDDSAYIARCVCTSNQLIGITTQHNQPNTQPVHQTAVDTIHQHYVLTHVNGRSLCQGRKRLDFGHRDHSRITIRCWSILHLLVAHTKTNKWKQKYVNTQAIFSLQLKMQRKKCSMCSVSPVQLHKDNRGRLAWQNVSPSGGGGGTYSGVSDGRVWNDGV